jgi:tetratricopeptide (TPR) repeat protein
VADDIRTLSEQLARDPASLVYAELAEALRRRGQLNEALRVALQGLSRHPQHVDGHDVAARVYADQGELARAREQWELVLEVAPEHVGALKGIGYVLYRQGDARGAASALEHALAVDPDDLGARRALDTVMGAVPRVAASAAAAATADGTPAQVDPAPAPAVAAPARPPVFGGLEGANADILLLDERGLVVAGGLRGLDGSDASELAAAALAGVSGEARRTAEYLALSMWETIVAETESSNLVLSPVGEGALLMVRRDRSVPIGLALRFAERARTAAARWLEGQGA